MFKKWVILPALVLGAGLFLGASSADARPRGFGPPPPPPPPPPMRVFSPAPCVPSPIFVRPIVHYRHYYCGHNHFRHMHRR